MAADFILSQSYSGGGGGVPRTTWSVHQLIIDPAYALVDTPLFNLNLTPADVGKTFTANLGTPFFAKNIGLATDGANNRVALFAGNGGNLAYEAEFFYGAPHSPFYTGTADLKGYSIDHVTLHVDQLTSVSPGSEPNHEGNWSDWTFTGTVAFYGSGSSLQITPEPGSPPQATPEPGSLALAMLGVIGIVAYRRRNFVLRMQA